MGIHYQRGLRGGYGGDSQRRVARRWRRGQGFSANALTHVPNSDLFQRRCKKVFFGAIVGDTGIDGCDNTERPTSSYRRYVFTIAQL